MRRRLGLAVLLSLGTHLLVLFWPGLEPLELPEPPGEASRIEARFLPPPVAVPQARVTPAPKPRPASGRAVALAEANTAQSGNAEAASAAPAVASPAPSVDATEPPVAASAALAEAPAPEPAASAALAEASQSAPATPAPFVLPAQGRVIFAGSIGGFVGLAAFGEASWTHDGQRLSSRLSAGLSAPDGMLDFRSESLLSGSQIISESTDDHRLSKHSTSRIDQREGVVHMQRGPDTRERTIKGLAVALSAMPQMLALLDPAIEKAAFFVVGDFWVEDSVLIAGGEESLRLPVGVVNTRHYQSRTAGERTIDIWIAPAWQNAPVRIRIRFDGYTIELKAASVEINHLKLAESPSELPRSEP